jgi:hypothetical protein
MVSTNSERLETHKRKMQAQGFKRLSLWVCPELEVLLTAERRPESAAGASGTASAAYAVGREQRERSFHAAQTDSAGAEHHFVELRQAILFRGAVLFGIWLTRVDKARREGLVSLERVKHACVSARSRPVCQAAVGSQHRI